ncbi:MAG TPA: ParB N-terminal domain-containing protein [Nitrosarchaeum sp.]
MNATVLLNLPISKLEDSPWHFRIMYDTDFNSLVKEIKKNGIDTIAPPIVAKINKKYYVVDGHSRIRASEKAGLEKIQCKITSTIKNLSDLRVQSFKLNKEGYSNPLSLSDMFYEDFQTFETIEKISDIYNVDKNYVQSVLKLRNLHDDTKSLINKIIDTAKRKYQFVLQQITPDHLSVLSDLSPSKQVEVVDWILRDIIYGPSDESLVSIPSIYEIIEEISQLTVNQEKKTYKKRNKIPYSKVKEFPLVCRCGCKFEIDTKSNSVFEYVEQNNVILKKKFEGDDSTIIYSSKTVCQSDLIELIKTSKQEVRVVVLKDNIL